MNPRALLRKEPTGTAIAVPVFGWFAFGYYLRGGDLVRRASFHPLSAPPAGGPFSAGLHTLVVERDNAGFFKRSDPGHVTPLINRKGRRLPRGWFPAFR